MARAAQSHSRETNNTQYFEAIVLCPLGFCPSYTADAQYGCVRRVAVSFLASEPCPGLQSLKSRMAKNSFSACETAVGSSCCSQWLASGSSVSWPFGQ